MSYCTRATTSRDILLQNYSRLDKFVPQTTAYASPGGSVLQIVTDWGFCLRVRLTKAPPFRWEPYPQLSCSSCLGEWGLRFSARWEGSEPFCLNCGKRVEHLPRNWGRLPLSGPTLWEALPQWWAEELDSLRGLILAQQLEEAATSWLLLHRSSA